VSGTALVTVAIGAKHAGLWQAHCRRDWEAYAARHGYDVICIDEPLDRSPRAAARSPTWQKCLILGQPFARRYERVVWIDADVRVNPAAPPIAEDVPADRVGAVDEYATPTPELYRQSLRKLYRHWDATGAAFERNETPREFYAAYGLPARHDNVVQAGVMVLSPRHHRDVLEHVYFDYEEAGGNLWGEWRPLSFELLEADAVEWIDPRFNYPWLVYKALHLPFLLNHPAHPRAPESAAAALEDVYCLHFAGSHEEIGLVDGNGHRRSAHPRRRAAPGASRRPARLTTPVALFAFARPDTTEQALAAVREAGPQKLLVVADAAPPERPELAAKCDEVRGLIDAIDWDCEVLTNYADRHMGLNGRIVSGLDWVFETVEEAIVLEDDCLPHPTFFGFCEEALARYRDDARVMTVSGDNFDFAPLRAAASYRWSRYPLIWGWATWRRAWRAHDPRMRRWPELRDARWLERLFDDPHAVSYWGHHFERTHRGDGSWDYAWTLTSWLAGALTVVPEVNLVTNVGFRSDATHTRDDDLSPFANLPAREMPFPLRHPREVAPDLDADRFLEDVLFSGNVHRMFERLRRARRVERAVV
jgi:hypothetical protein